MPSWKDYQGEVASLFEALGCKAELDKRVRGVRATHSIDVWVEFSHFGLPSRWVVECKRWRKSIPKEKVLSLKSVVEDVGADRGILVASVSFQRGATDAARETSIVLTSLTELRRLASTDLMKGSLTKLELKVGDISAEFVQEAYITEQTGQDTWHSYPNPAIYTEEAGEGFASLATLKLGIGSTRLGRFPAIVAYDSPRKHAIFAHDLEEFLRLAAPIVEKAERAWLQAKAGRATSRGRRSN